MHSKGIVRHMASAMTSLILASMVRADGVPEISGVSLTQAANRRVTIEYTLSAPAVVTLDIQTNACGDVWASIGGGNIYGAETRARPRGDVSKLVQAGSRSITWDPSRSWPDNTGATPSVKAVLTAWPVNDTPDYMVVDIAEGTPLADRVRYYASTNDLPGGLLANGAYRTTSIVMRKIVAKDISWTMGSLLEQGRSGGLSEDAHDARLTNNYYIAVFPTTQAQWKSITSSKNPEFKVEGSMRPMESICYNAVRCCAVGKTAAESGTDWPNPPYSGSWLGLLRDRTQIDFDLPSEGEWEYACRAGFCEGYWGTGRPILSSTTDGTEDPNFPGRYKYNQATSGNTSNLSGNGPEDCTPIVGSYAPNAWGIYDQCGGVREMCLDWSAGNIKSLAGLVNTTVSSKRIIRGGDWKSEVKNARPAYRDEVSPSATETAYMGFAWCVALAWTDAKRRRPGS